MAGKQVRLERVRVTKVGIWYILIALVVGVAAANTGNNALYLVEALILAMLAISGLASKRNLTRMALEFGSVPEAHAGQVFSVPVRVVNEDSWFPRRYVEVGGLEEAEGFLVPYLPRRGALQQRMGFLVKTRGLHRFPFVRIASVFPLGLFDKAMRYPAELEVVVYPEIFPASEMRFFDPAKVGDEPSRRAGWSHELRTLRAFQTGDDPRGIHWKRSARTGELVFMEREAEEGQRLSILLDNAVGLLDPVDTPRFERLVSEAASAAVHYLAQGYEVRLKTRDEEISFGQGRIQRQRILTSLALLEPRRRVQEPLWRGRQSRSELRMGWIEPEIARRAS